MGLGPGSGFSGFFGGVNQGEEWVQDYDTRKLQNEQRQEDLNAQKVKNNATRVNAQAYANQNGYGQIPQVQTGDPVISKIVAKFKGAFTKNGSTAGQSTPPAAQATVPGAANAAASPPGPSSSSSSAGGLPGASGAQTLDSATMPITQSGVAQTPQQQGPPFADGGIPSRTGLRMRKAKPANKAPPTKAASAAMHPPMEKAPQDNATMGAEGGPPRNTDAQPGSQDPMLADGGIPTRGARMRNGGKVNIPQMQDGVAPPQPNAVEKDTKNFGEQSRFSRTIKKLADGGGPANKPDADPNTPAVGLEGAQQLPETVLHHLATTALGVGAKAARFASDPVGSLMGVGEAIGKPIGEEAGAFLNSPYNPQEAPPQQGPPKTPAQDPNAGSQSGDAGPPAPAQDGSDDAHAIPIEVISKEESQHIQLTGKRLDGSPAKGPYMVDMGNGKTVPQPGSEDGSTMPAIGDQGIPGRASFSSRQSTTTPGQSPTPAAPQQPDAAKPPIDFSNVDIDHRDIPNTTAEDWDELKKRSMFQMISNGVPPAQAKIAVEDSVSDYQHRQFMQMMQQGIALDRQGDKQGAMAALKTAYQYMPTGHDVQFGVDKTTGNIVGFGVDEKTGKPVGAPVLLDQKNLNGLLATYQDPKAFQNESLAMREQALKERKFNADELPLSQAQGNYYNAHANYMNGANDTRLETAMIRAASSGRSMLPPQTQKFYAQQLNGALPDPRDQGEALGVAEVLEKQYGSSPQTQGKIVALLKQMYSLSPEARAQFAQQNHIPLPSLQQQPDMSMSGYGGYGPQAGGYGVPPR